MAQFIKQVIILALNHSKYTHKDMTIAFQIANFIQDHIILRNPKFQAIPTTVFQIYLEISIGNTHKINLTQSQKMIYIM